MKQRFVLSLLIGLLVTVVLVSPAFGAEEGHGSKRCEQQADRTSHGQRPFADWDSTVEGVDIHVARHDRPFAVRLRWAVRPAGQMGGASGRSLRRR